MSREWEASGAWYSEEASIYESMIADHPQFADDKSLELLFHVALFAPEITPAEKEDAYYVLDDYLWEEYGWELGDVLDWEAYREWYEGQ